MYGLRRIYPGRSLRRRIGAAIALAAYLSATVGFALPHPVQKGGRPFPCQHHLCGCQTAEQCWRHCCCFSPEERRSWAREHNVPIPADAEPVVPTPPVAKNNSWCSVRLRDRAAGKTGAHACGSCCAGKKTHASARKQTRSCCSTQAKADQRSNVPGGRWRFGLSALRCQGLNTVWISAGAVLPVPAGPEWNPGLTPVCQLSPVSCRAVRLTPEPLAPPPRFDCA